MKIILPFLLLICLFLKVDGQSYAPDSTFEHNSLKKDVSLRFLGNTDGNSYFVYRSYSDQFLQLVGFDSKGKIILEKEVKVAEEPMLFTQIDDNRYLIKQTNNQGIIQIKGDFIPTQNLSENLLYNKKLNCFFGFRDGYIRKFDLNLNEIPEVKITAIGLDWLDVLPNGDFLIDNGEEILQIDQSGNRIESFKAIDRKEIQEDKYELVDRELQNDVFYLALATAEGPIRLKAFSLNGLPTTADPTKTKIAYSPIRRTDISDEQWAIIAKDENLYEHIKVYEKAKGLMLSYPLLGLKDSPSTEGVHLLGFDKNQNFFVSTYGYVLVRVSQNNQKYLVEPHPDGKVFPNPMTLNSPVYLPVSYSLENKLYSIAGKETQFTQRPVDKNNVEIIINKASKGIYIFKAANGKQFKLVYL